MRDWFINEADKHNYLQQVHCKICDIEGVRFFPIRISPKSRQIKSSLKNRFQESIAKAPYVKSNAFKTADRICIKLIFVINKSRDKDLDNMVKITIDGLKKVLIPDDKQIDHLEAIKFNTKHIEEFISITIGHSNLNKTDKILFTGENLSWAGLDKIIP